MTDYIEREAAKNILKRHEHRFTCADEANGFGSVKWSEYVIYSETAQNCMDALPAADVRPVPDGGIGEMSDGYHTFNGLYYQRMVLFAALVNAHNDRAWKSWKHEDGEPCFGGGWFIVGIDTPQGSYTYHYEDKYWNWFECEELPVARHWDGHTEEDVTRLLALPDVREVKRGEWKRHHKKKDGVYSEWCVCSVCGQMATAGACYYDNETPFCPWCGADMRGASDEC